MKVTATALRQNIYSILDHAIATGQPVEVERKGKIVRLVPEMKPNDDDEEITARLEARLAGLKKHDWFIGPSENFIHMDWSHEWSELKRKPATKKRSRA